MAGLGRKVFTAGDVLTASDVQNYLMDQTVMNFAGTAARSSAIATPTDGMVTYNQTTNSLEAYNGTDWINKSGLQMIKKQTVGSGVSSVTVTGAFSSIYENYRIIISKVDASEQDSTLYLKLGGSTGSTYFSAVKWVPYSSGTMNGTQNTASSDGMFIGLTSTTNDSNFVIDLFSPFLAERTSMTTQSAQGSYMVYGGGLDSNAASSTSFSLTPFAGTLTGGTIYVYGYGV